MIKKYRKKKEIRKQIKNGFTCEPSINPIINKAIKQLNSSTWRQNTIKQLSNQATIRHTSMNKI